MFFLGIDPGAKGAFTLLDGCGEIVVAKVFPAVGGKLSAGLLFEAFFESLQHTRPDQIRSTIEKVHAMPGQGVSSSFSFGMAFGYIEMIHAALWLPYVRVSPIKWTKAMHVGVDQGIKNPKDRSEFAARMLWPRQNFLATSKCKRPHSGLIDSALIAEYGRRTHFATEEKKL